MSRRHRILIRERQGRVTVGLYSILLGPQCQTRACRRYAKRLLAIIEPEVRKKADKAVEEFLGTALYGETWRYRVRIMNSDPPAADDRNYEAMSEYFGRLTR